MFVQLYRNCSILLYLYREDYVGLILYYLYVLWIEIRVKSVKGYSLNNVIYILLVQFLQDFISCSIVFVVKIICLVLDGFFLLFQCEFGNLFEFLI